MKKLLILLLCLFTTDLFGSGIGAGTSASCDNATLDKYTGTVNAEIDWEPNTIQLNWYSDDEKLTVATASQSCVYNGMITVPPQPTKPGYTFNGWKIKKIMVPSGYTQLEYIESTGTQHIDTGISPHSDNIIYKASWLETTLERWASVFGIANYDNGSGYYSGILYHSSYGMTYLATAFSDGMCPQSNIVANQVNTVEIIIKNGVLTKIQNGASCTARYNGSVQIGRNITLFCNLGSPDQNSTEHSKYTQLFYWQMWDNGVLVRDMIPARRNSDGVLGMWDTVSKTFFTNAGTGSFIAGPAVTE